MEWNGQATKERYDPDPYVLCSLLLAAASATATVAGAIASVETLRIAKRDHQQARRTHILDAYKALKTTQRVLEQLIQSLDRAGALDAHFGVGRLRLFVDRSQLAEFQAMLDKTLDSLRALSEASVGLSILLRDEDLMLMRTDLSELDSFVREAVRSRRYATFVVRMSAMLQRLEQHIRHAAREYDLRLE